MTSTLDPAAISQGGQAAGEAQTQVPGSEIPTSPNVAPQTGLSPSDAVTAAINAAPELAKSPGTAMAVAQSGGDTPSRAQAVAQGAKRQATATGFDRVKASAGDALHDAFSWLGHVVPKPVGTAVGDLAKAANAPLRFVQHEYRYLHDVEARHGIGAAFGEGIGIALGAAAGGLVAGPEGIMLGAEGATALEGQFAYRDSWAKTASANYRDPNTGKLISFGRDIASVLGLHGEGFTDMSGVIDAIGDYTADPLALAGKVKGAANSVEGLGGALGSKYAGLRATSENVESAYANYAGVRRSFNTIASMEPGEIVRMDQRLAPIADLLGRAQTGEDVAQVFREALKSQELAQTITSLPTMSLTRIPLHNLAMAYKDSDIGVVQHMSQRLEQLPGATWDPSKMDYSSTHINPGDLYGLPDVMRLVRYSQTERVAQAVGSAYAYATPAERIGIVKNAIMDNIFGLAKTAPPPEDADLGDYLSELTDANTKNAIIERLSQHMDLANPQGADAGRIFGMTIHGKPISSVVSDDGTEFQGAITANQVGKISIPSLVETRRMAQAIRSTKMSRLLSGTDDFLYDHVTQGFFKPLVLQSAGYAEHISMAEVIPNAARLGLRKIASGAFHNVAGKLGYAADEDDLNAFQGWLYRLTRMVPRSQRETEIDARWYQVTHGYGHTMGLGAGENYAQEVIPEERAAQAFRQARAQVPLKEGNDFGAFGSEAKRFPELWQDELRENAGDPATRVAATTYLHSAQSGRNMVQASEEARQAVSAHLRSQPEEYLSQYVRAQFKRADSPQSWDPIDSWASDIVEKMKGAVHGSEASDFKLHTDLVRQISQGATPKLGELKDITGVDRPAMMKGRLLVPDGTSAIQRIAGFGFRHVLNPMVNFLSRDPLGREEFSIQFKALEKSIANGTFTDDEATTLAAARATVHSMRFVHNLHDRTQWTATLRNWAPFFFAQEQAYRRMGRLLVEDPGAFRRYQMEISAIHNIAANMQDSEGNRYIVFPGSGWLGKGVPAILGKMGVPVSPISPAGFGGSFSAANVIFPLSQGFRPDLGPVAAIPAQALGSLFPELGKKYSGFRPIANVATSTLDYAIGSEAMSTPIWEQLVPNTFVQRVIETAQGDDRSFNSAFMQTLQALDYQQNLAMERWVKGGREGPMPDIVPPQSAGTLKVQAFLDRVQNQTRILYGVRAILGLVSPVSADVEVSNYGFPAQLNADIAKEGSVSKGITAFLAKNPDATPYTVFQSTNTSGAVVPESDLAEQWIDQHMALIQAHPQAAMWLMPQMGKSAAKYDPNVYNTQLAQGIRAKDTPAQFLTALYTAAGDQIYYSALATHEAALQAAGDNETAKSAEYTTWDAYLTNLETKLPVWATNYLSGQKQVQRQQTITGLKSIIADGQAPDTNQTALVKQLLGAYDAAQADYLAATQEWDYTTAESKVKENWQNQTTQWATQYPALQPIITSIFRDALDQQT